MVLYIFKGGHHYINVLKHGKCIINNGQNIFSIQDGSLNYSLEPVEFQFKYVGTHIGIDEMHHSSDGIVQH